MNYIKTKIISASLLIVIIIIVLFTSVFNKKHDRYVLFFKNSITGKIDTEIRYVPVQNITEPEAAFFEELMLGPVNHHCYSFIEAGSKLLSCFVKDGILYADLPLIFIEDIKQEFDSDEIKALLQKNIFTNCKDLKAAHIFIEGIEIYELLKK
ncbi:GerMN domain-containing protein [Treponema sp. OMZ 799]|uniref:GerMN domain-containing protein n=1 Tax=Treponema sp. OMZ 799 TaxID=2563668 RepID=UPI0020A2BDF9|nr:GerMN domain-containing protein [Treponema sp. OMZ 799]UTC78077.1 GerMN domain-containing protein [Treponema sp. OMZ 799]